MKVHRVAALSFLLMFVLAGTVQANKSLAGMIGVFVIIEDLGDGGKSLGLTKASIKTDVELRLRQSSIEVLNTEEGLDRPGSPYLYVNVLAVKQGNRESFVYSIYAILRQSVILERSPDTQGLVATTWKSTGGIGIVPSDSLNSELRQGVQDQVDDFINAYLAANPAR